MPVTRSMTRGGAPSLVTTCEPLVVEKEETLRDNTEIVVSTGPVIVGTGGATAAPDSKSSTSLLTDEIVNKNRVLLLRLEQDGILAPGVVTIDPSGELRADLSAQPDPGTMSGLYPDMAVPVDIDEQIPSWLRDYLVKELHVLGRGPPTACQALCEGLKRSQDEPGINPSVWLTETQLSCAAVSLQHAIDDVRDFVKSGIVIDDTYEKEFGMIIRTVLRLVGCSFEEAPKGVQLLFEMGSAGVTMKCALDEPLERLIITPYSKLVEKIQAVAKVLQQDLQRTRQSKDGDTGDGDTASNADSAVEFCDF